MTYQTVETPAGPALLDTDSDGELIAAHNGYTVEQIEFAAKLLNEEGIGGPDEIAEAVVYTNCVSCEETFMQAQLDASKRCWSCAP